MTDEPRSLEKPEVRSARHEMLKDDHISPLTEFVLKMRKEKNLSTEIPFFDPLDGGVNARVLIVLQDPGSKTQETGFVSRNNPDFTAENLFNAYEEAGIPRHETILWNLYPWAVEKNFLSNFEEGIDYLKKLIKILPKLEVIVLHGVEAKKAEVELKKSFNDLKLILSSHTTNNYRTYAKYKAEINKDLKEVYYHLYK